MFTAPCFGQFAGCLCLWLWQISSREGGEIHEQLLDSQERLYSKHLVSNNEHGLHTLFGLHIILKPANESENICHEIPGKFPYFTHLPLSSFSKIHIRN